MNLIFQLRWLFQDILSYNFESLISRSKKEFFHVFFWSRFILLLFIVFIGISQYLSSKRNSFRFSSYRYINRFSIKYDIRIYLFLSIWITNNLCRNIFFLSFFHNFWTPAIVLLFKDLNTLHKNFFRARLILSRAE